MMKTFEEVFNAMPTVIASAPGRVNLLGEHTDYNDGYVMTTAIPQHTSVSMRFNKSESFRLYLAALDQLVEFDLSKPPNEYFATYIFGCLRNAQDLGVNMPALDIHICSNVPMGVGLSSSAALEVAMLRALRELLNVDINILLQKWHNKQKLNTQKLIAALWIKWPLALQIHNICCFWIRERLDVKN